MTTYPNKSCQFIAKKIIFITNRLIKNKVLTAIAIAMSDSVTVSIGEDTRGAFKVIFFVN